MIWSPSFIYLASTCSLEVAASSPHESMRLCGERAAEAGRERKGGWRGGGPGGSMGSFPASPPLARCGSQRPPITSQG
ncbi:hypothetical protein B484DRAFT_409098 [Ochromonadaceae sp. CCMP2298]|nr:hypothetical protein B484DRAFT_409098 [Ochromonadaceae sp. CCMP2298]